MQPVIGPRQSAINESSTSLMDNRPRQFGEKANPGKIDRDGDGENHVIDDFRIEHGAEGRPRWVNASLKNPHERRC
jgi:hypothetical protein